MDDPSAERRRSHELAGAIWPAIHVSFEDFCEHLDQLGYGRTLPSQVGPLYLCIACCKGSGRAFHLFESTYFPALRTFLARFDCRPDVIDDLLQQIRYRLFVGPKPRIRGYRGEGAFEGWLRRVASSVAVDFFRAQGARERRRQRFMNEVVCREHVHASTALLPDEQLHRERCAATLNGAVNRALRSLSQEQRQLLHHFYVSELTIDDLSAIYGCHRSVAARRVVSCVKLVQRALRHEVALTVPRGIEREGWSQVLYQRAEIG
jgi:RNA polymerase sigma-70 factor